MNGYVLALILHFTSWYLFITTVNVCKGEPYPQSLICRCFSSSFASVSQISKGGMKNSSTFLSK